MADDDQEGGLGPRWYCAQFNRQRAQGDAEAALWAAAESIFGEDLEEVVVAGERLDDSLFEVQSEGYFFVKCSNYESHVKGVEQSPLVERFLPSNDAPVPVPFEEVERFRKAASSLTESKPLDVGDVVTVRAGHLSKLTGIVAGCRDGRYEVWFKLYTVDFVSTIPRANLTLVGSVEEKLPPRRRHAENRLRGRLDRVDAYGAPSRVPAS